MVAYISGCSKADNRLEGTTPDCINSILKTTSRIHYISICFSNLNLIVLFKENTVGCRTFSVRRILHWNKLSANVKKVKNVKLYKKKLIVYDLNY